MTLICLFIEENDIRLSDGSANDALYYIYHINSNKPSNVSEDKLTFLFKYDHFRGICFTNEFDNAEHYVKFLFKHMPNLRYVWVANNEYSIENGIIMMQEYDCHLRVASLHYKNELLDGDYKNRFCIYLNKHGKK